MRMETLQIMLIGISTKEPICKVVLDLLQLRLSILLMLMIPLLLVNSISIDDGTTV